MIQTCVSNNIYWEVAHLDLIALSPALGRKWSTLPKGTCSPSKIILFLPGQWGLMCGIWYETVLCQIKPKPINLHISTHQSRFQWSGPNAKNWIPFLYKLRLSWQMVHITCPFWLQPPLQTYFKILHRFWKVKHSINTKINIWKWNIPSIQNNSFSHSCKSVEQCPQKQLAI